MTFSDVGCGSNACWFKWLLLYRIFTSSLLGGSLCKRRIDAMMNRFPDSLPLALIDCVSIGLLVLNVYFNSIALKASRSDKCERQLWQRWSTFVKVTMIIFGVGGGGLALMVLVAGSTARGDFGSDARIVITALWIVLGVVTVLVGEGIILLLTKNRFEEKVQEEEAGRRGGDLEYLKPV